MSENSLSKQGNSENPIWLSSSRSILTFLSSGGPIQKTIPWVIVEFFLVPFSWLISYLQWSTAQPSGEAEKESAQDGSMGQNGHSQSDGWHIGAFFIIMLISAVLGLFLDGSIPGDAWFRMLFVAFIGTLLLSLPSNIFTILFMYLLSTPAIVERREILTSELESHHQQLVKEFKEHDKTTTNGFQDSYWRMDQILGHKVWAEERTYKFLSRIVQNEAREKAKWQMVNFLSRLADNHIFPEEDSGYFRITTASSGTWHISEYSDFLSDNIMHASKEIRWLVDPKDFYEYLIPFCVLYLLGSIAAKTVGLPSETVWKESNEVSLDFLFSRVIKEACPKYCEETETREYLDKLASDHHAKRNQPDNSHAHEHGIKCIAEKAIFLKQGRSVGWWHDLHDIVFPGIAYFGNKVIMKDGVPDEKVIIDGFSEFYEKWVKRAFPHIDSFRRASSDRASRQLLLPHAESINSSLQIVADNISQAIFNGDTALGELPIEKRLTVVRLALRLFGELSGGAKRIDVIGFKGPYTATATVFNNYDVGLYDNKFLVRSIAEGYFRQVEWYYLFQRPEKDNRLPADIKHLTDILEYKITEKLSTLLKNTSLWKTQYEHSDSEYDILSDVLCNLINIKWKESNGK